MPKRCAGFIISGDSVIYVIADIPDDDDDPIEIVEDSTWPLQKGDRASAYEVMHSRCSNYLSENEIDAVVIKASAPAKATTVSHLQSAELRGVVIAAAAGTCSVRTMLKSAISNHYGDKDKKVDDYIKDDEFWDENTSGGKLRKNSRETAMLIIAARAS